jgi:glutamine amidotransferase-like uncharacterized protein
MRAFAALLTLCLTACGGVQTTDAKAGGSPILLFTGHGTSPNDVAALEQLLTAHNFGYVTADSSRLNGMTEAELRAYQLLLVPGGNFEEIGNGLTTSTSTRLHKAVRAGLNYFGICAGAFFAGDSPYNGLDLTSGVRFPFYAAESRGIRKAPVNITPAGSVPLDQYWEDGPQLTGWGEVVATYPDGTPAVVQGTVGEGWVILSGIHPEAPDGWRRGMTFFTPANVDNAYAVTLIDAALRRTRLPHY